MRTKSNAMSTVVGTAAIVLVIILFTAFYSGADGSLIIIIVFFVMILLLAMAFSGSIIDKTAIRRYVPEPRDPSQVRRVIAESSSGLEIIVRGHLKMTYREACLNYWDFKIVNKSDNWIIVDERGNDITNTSLDSYNGLARLVLIGGPTTSTRSAYDEVEKYQESSESDYGVTYYD